MPLTVSFIFVKSFLNAFCAGAARIENWLSAVESERNGLKQLILIRRGNGHWRPVLGRVYLSKNVRHAPELPLTGPVL